MQYQSSFFHVSIGKIFTWLIFLHNQRLWWLWQIWSMVLGFILCKVLKHDTNQTQFRQHHWQLSGEKVYEIHVIYRKQTQLPFPRASIILGLEFCQILDDWLWKFSFQEIFSLTLSISCVIYNLPLKRVCLSNLAIVSPTWFITKKSPFD